MPSSFSMLQQEVVHAHAMHVRARSAGRRAKRNRAPADKGASRRLLLRGCTTSKISLERTALQCAAQCAGQALQAAASQVKLVKTVHMRMHYQLARQLYSRYALLQPVQHCQAGCVWRAACWVGFELVHKVIVAAGQLGSLHAGQGLDAPHSSNDSTHQHLRTICSRGALHVNQDRAVT